MPMPSKGERTRVNVRIPTDLLAKVDGHRGTQSRDDWFAIAATMRLEATHTTPRPNVEGMRWPSPTEQAQMDTARPVVPIGQPYTQWVDEHGVTVHDADGNVIVNLGVDRSQVADLTPEQWAAQDQEKARQEESAQSKDEVLENYAGQGRHLHKYRPLEPEEAVYERGIKYVKSRCTCGATAMRRP